MQLASDELVVLPRRRCAGGECRRVTFRDELVSLVARIAEGHDISLPLQHGAQHEENERCAHDCQTHQPGGTTAPSRESPDGLVVFTRLRRRCRLQRSCGAGNPPALRSFQPADQKVATVEIALPGIRGIAPRRSSALHAAINHRRHHAAAQIIRERSCHAGWPPSPARILNVTIRGRLPVLAARALAG